MMYKKVTIETDNEILKDVNIIKLAKLVPCTAAFLYQVKNNHIICGEKFRDKVIRAKTLLYIRETPTDQPLVVSTT